MGPLRHTTLTHGSPSWRCFERSLEEVRERECGAGVGLVFREIDIYLCACLCVHVCVYVCVCVGVWVCMYVSTVCLCVCVCVSSRYKLGGRTKGVFFIGVACVGVVGA